MHYLIQKLHEATCKNTQVSETNHIQLNICQNKIFNYNLSTKFFRQKQPECLQMLTLI